MFLDVLFANPMTQWIISLFFLFLIMRLFAYFAQSGLIGKADNYLKYCEKVLKSATVKTTTLAWTYSNILSLPDIEARIRRLIKMFDISPVAKDPAGIMNKIRQNLDTGKEFIFDEIRAIAADGTEQTIYRLVLMASVSNAMYTIIRYLRHFVEGAKKKDEIAKMNIIASFRLIKELFSAYETAFLDFYNNRTIGDGIGPLTVAHIAHENNVEWKKHYNFNSTAEFEFHGRHVTLVKATGPYGNTGRVGRFISMYNPHAVITVDAALKMRGEETGEVRFGIGAAIGGAGYERYVIEGTDSKRYAIVVPMSMEEAITVMPEKVFNALPDVMNLVEYILLNHTNLGDSVIIAGVGNTLGVDG